MSNLVISNIILVLLLLIFMYFILYKFLKKNINTIHDFILENGHDALAEVLGYTLIHYYPPLPQGGGSKCIVLKFKDIDNREHIIVDTRKPHSFINFNKGDLINIKYIESSRLDNNLLKKYNIFNTTLNNMKVNVFTNYIYQNNEEIILTDDHNTFLILILDSPTNSNQTIIINFIICLCVFVFIACLFLLL